MAALDAVVHGVVLVLLRGQAQVLERLVWRGPGQPVQGVVGVFGGAQVAADLGDVAGFVV